MDRDQILAIRDRSSAKTKEGKVVGPWATDQEEMWRKTVVRRASKYMPRATDAFSNAVALDNLLEVGHEVDIKDGEVIDVTADVVAHDAETGEIYEEVIAAPATSQMDRIAQKVAKPEPEPEVEITKLHVGVDADGDEDWDGWVANAINQVKDMSPNNRSTWRKLHLSMIDEAELMNARDLSKLITILKG
jgi:hypothetical protein